MISHEPTLAESQVLAVRCAQWFKDPRRAAAVIACAEAGNKAMNDPTVPFVEPFLCVDVACAGQILFGEYDNSKVAEPAFVAAVLVEARKFSDLADAPGLRGST